MEGAALQGAESFAHQLGTAIDEPGIFGSELHRLFGDIVVILLIWLGEIGGVGMWNGAIIAHPEDGCGGIEPAAKRDSDILAGWEIFEDIGHMLSSLH